MILFVMRLANIRAQRYRRLRDSWIRLEGLNVIVGPNGSGKSSILECLGLVSQAADRKLADALSAVGGIGAVQTQGNTQPLSLTFSFTLEHEQPIDYNLQLRPRGTGFDIAYESLTQLRPGDFTRPFIFFESKSGKTKYYDGEARKLLEPSWSYDEFETALGQVPRMFQQAESIRNLLQEYELYQPICLDSTSRIRQPQALQPSFLPGNNGESLVSSLYNLREQYRDRFEQLVDILRDCFQGFERIDFPLVASGTASLAWKDKNFSQPFYLHQLSEGTIRFIWLCSILLSPKIPPIVAIDEPELSLHPELVMQLVSLLRAAADVSVVIVATHSERLVRLLTPSEVMVTELDLEGGAQVFRGTDLNLEHWLREYELDVAIDMRRQSRTP